MHGAQGIVETHFSVLGRRRRVWAKLGARQGSCARSSGRSRGERSKRGRSPGAFWCVVCRCFVCSIAAHTACCSGSFLCRHCWRRVDVFECRPPLGDSAIGPSASVSCMLRHGVTLSLAAYRLLQRGVRRVGRACRVVGASQAAMGTAVHIS